MLRIYNSLTNRKEPFKPIEPGRIRLYVCGMTVYDYCHIGHARVLVIFDAIVRYLRARGFEITYVRNITDIDDKIIQRAGENGESVAVLTQRYIEAMHEDCRALDVAEPDVEPRATDSMQAIIRMIAVLIDRGYAYVAANGDVYYDVSRFVGYGKLSGKDPRALRAGERIEVSEAKDDPLDFVLWKTAKPDEPSWDSPWGEGRPGWHIECSAMSTRWLGNHFDIHGGGQDLQFPHHENEIAQSEAATAEPFVNYWMHNGFVRVNEDKMSKSLGNFFTVREVFTRYRPEEVRLFILTSHYRSPLNFSDEQLENARQGLTRLYTALRGLPAAEPSGDSPYEERFVEAMDDDFNTAGALAVLFELARDINKARERAPDQAKTLATRLKRMGGELGLLGMAPEAYLTASTRADAPGGEEIDAMVAARGAARVRRDWREADRIRDKLLEQDVVLEDRPAGTIWRRRSR